MSKRTATSNLTDRNWDQEDEPEEAGEFVKASDDAIKLRQIIKAKRKYPGSSEGGSAFSGFGGFAFKPNQTSTPLLGSGLKTESKTEQKKPNLESPVKSADTKPSNGQSQNGSGKDASAERSTYLSNLKCLNESVLKWITQHVEKNPYCILTPIFKDYEKHFNELEKESESPKSEAKADDDGEESKAAKPSEETAPAAPKTGLTFGFGQLNPDKTMTSTQPPAFKGFGFNLTGTSTCSSTTTTSVFSFGVGKNDPQSSTNTVTTSSAGDDEEYVPPKPEVNEIKEEGSLYSKKCKLFFQKGGQWTERGVGHLHLKEVNEKLQLLIRADTNLGNILLNIMLNQSIPLKKQGKNNISMICIPNPPVDAKSDDKTPVPMLIRVKTSDDADEVISKCKEMMK